MSKKTKLEEVGYEDSVRKKPKQPAHVFLKLVSVLLLAGMLVGIFVPVYFSLVDGSFKIVNGSVFGEGSSIFEHLKDALQAWSETSGKKADLLNLVYDNGPLFGVVVAAGLMIISTIVTLFTRKAAPAWFRITCIIGSLAFVIYGDCVFNEVFPVADIVMITGAVATVALIVSAFHSLANGKEKAGIPAFCFLLSIASIVMTVLYSFVYIRSSLCLNAIEYFLGIVKEPILLIVTKDHVLAWPALEMHQAVTYILFAVLVINAIFTAFQMGIIKTNAFTVIRYFIQLGITVVAMIMTIIAVGPIVNILIPFASVAAFSLLAFVLSLIRVCTPPEEEEVIEDDLEEEMDAALEEEPAQPYPYPVPNIVINITNGSVETTEKGDVKEINVNTQPAAVVAPVVVPVEEEDDEDDEEETDPFLLTLGRKERREFKQVFLSGNAPDYLPEYKKNANNRRFFDMVFVYLNKTRQLMSPTLLKNIYDFMQENK